MQTRSGREVELDEQNRGLGHGALGNARPLSVWPPAILSPLTMPAPQVFQASQAGQGREEQQHPGAECRDRLSRGLYVEVDDAFDFTLGQAREIGVGCKIGEYGFSQGNFLSCRGGLSEGAGCFLLQATIEKISEANCLPRFDCQRIKNKTYIVIAVTGPGIVEGGVVILSSGIECPIVSRLEDIPDRWIRGGTVRVRRGVFDCQCPSVRSIDGKIPAGRSADYRAAVRPQVSAPGQLNLSCRCAGVGEAVDVAAIVGATGKDQAA